MVFRRRRREEFEGFWPLNSQIVVMLMVIFEDTHRSAYRSLLLGLSAYCVYNSQNVNIKLLIFCLEANDFICKYLLLCTYIQTLVFRNLVSDLSRSLKNLKTKVESKIHELDQTFTKLNIFIYFRFKFSFKI